MISPPKTDFLQHKIMELQQALFFYLGNAVLRLPTSLINVLWVDEVGQVWFFLHRPSQNATEFDREFHAKLDFYKKGKNFYLHLTGKACMVTDPEEINAITFLSEGDKKHAITDMVLMKFRVHETLYYPFPQPKIVPRPEGTKISLHPSGFIKTLQYIVKDIIPVFQSH